MSIKLKDQNNNEIFIAGTNSEDFINDEVLRNDKTWSSNKIVEELYPTFQKEGNPIICYPVENYPLNVKATFSPKQAGSGDPSPDNVRAIVGRESVSVTASGKNLANVFNIDSEVSAQSNILHRNEDGSIYVERNNPSNSAVMSGVTLRELCPGIVPGTYMLTAESTGVSKFIYASAIWEFGMAMTLNESALDALVYFYADQDENNTTALITNFQIELGSTPTAYEPYQGTTATLTLPETIYGGTVDAVSGVGSEEWEAVTLSSEFLTTNHWTYGAAGNQTSPVIYGAIPMANSTVGDIYCTHFKRGNNLPIENLEYWSDSLFFGIRRIAIRNDDWTSLDDAKTWLDAQASAGTPVQVTYKLATPEPFQATGNQALPAVAGLNTVYTDGDSLIISGKEDIKYTINQITSNIQNIDQIQEINNILLGVE